MSDSYDFINPDRPKKVQRTVEVKEDTGEVNTDHSNTEKAGVSDTDDVNTTVLDNIVSFLRGVFK